MNKWPKVAVIVPGWNGWGEPKYVVPRRPSQRFAREGRVANEAGGIGILAGGARAIPVEKRWGRDCTNSYKIRG